MASPSGRRGGHPTLAVHLEIDDPDAEHDLDRRLPLVRWFLAPHYLVYAYAGVRGPERRALDEGYSSSGSNSGTRYVRTKASARMPSSASSSQRTVPASSLSARTRPR